jgi:ubiquinone/menaquinone biosynthesis C-methylase UbiE
MHNIYTDGTYLQHIPTWHEEDSPWKAAQISRMLQKHPLDIRSVAEIGCGAGGILAELHGQLPANVEYSGFDIASDAIAIAKKKERPRLTFYAEDLLLNDASFDLLLAMDVFEHVPDYLGFLQGCCRKAKYKIYHIPLDVCVSFVVRAQFVPYRKVAGHIHSFTAETALATLTDTGHKIIDSFYTNGALELASLHPSVRTTLSNIPRRLVSLFSTKWAARLLGGYSLLVLAE